MIYLQKRHEQGQNEVTSENVKSDLKIGITFKELNDFVNHMKGLNEIPAGITVEMTYEEKVKDKIGKYNGEKWGLTPDEAYKIVEYLNKLPDNSDVNSDQI